jgi:hypothetical protein
MERIVLDKGVAVSRSSGPLSLARGCYLLNGVCLHLV